MHIAILNVFFAPHTYGGATVVAEEVGRRLVADAGCRVSAISAMSRPDVAPYAVIRTESDGMASWLINLPPGRGYIDAYRNPRVAERIGRILRQIEPDIAHLHCLQEIGADCMTEIEAAGIPMILSVHDFWWLCERQFMLRPDGSYCGQSPVDIDRCRGCVDDIGRTRARASYLSAVARQADLVTYPSRFARELAEASGLAPGQGVVWENGVRLPGPGFFEAQARRRAADGRLSFGFVGGPSQLKGWPIMRDAFAGLAEGTALRGLLVDGSRDGSWWRGVDLGGLKGDWTVVPRYEQRAMDDFFAEIDVLLFLSQWKETFGLTIREAIARGIRVIQTDSGGTMEHPLADPATALAIGDDAEVLRERILAELARPAAHPDPVPVTSHADQAASFLSLAEDVLAWRRPAGRPSRTAKTSRAA